MGLSGLGGLGNLGPTALSGLRVGPQLTSDSTHPSAPSTPAGPIQRRGTPPAESPTSEAGPQRLYVVVHKGATEDMLIALFQVRAAPNPNACELPTCHACLPSIDLHTRHACLCTPIWYLLACQMGESEVRSTSDTGADPYVELSYKP